MTPEEAPSGTLCSVGHPANGNVVRKEGDNWYFVGTNVALTDYDTLHKSLNALYIPGCNHSIERVDPDPQT